MKVVYYLVPLFFRLNHSIVFVVFLFFYSTLLYANTSQKTALSLNSAVDISISNNPDLAQIQARYNAMKQRPSQLSTLPDPVINIGAMNFPTDTFNRTQEAMTQVQIGFTQQFPFPGKLSLREEAAEFEAKAAFYTVDEMRLKLIKNISSTWWQIYYFDRSIETINTNQSLLRQFIKVAKTKYKTGKGLQQDVLLAQLELSKLINQKIQVNSMRRNQEIKLNMLMGRVPSKPIILPLDIEKKLYPLIKEEELYQVAEEFRPIIKMREEKVSASNSQLNLAKKGYYPDFKLSLLYGNRIGVNPGPMKDPRSDFVSVMLGIKIPLYAASKQSKAIEQKISERQETSFALADEKLQMMADISDGLTQYHKAQEQLILLETGIIPQARQTVESMLAAYQVSKVDFLNLVRSQVTLFNYELLYWKALIEAKQAEARIQATVGKVDIHE